MAIGLYIHVPFCLSKCPYCDFYSGPPTEEGMDRYTDAVCRSLREWGGRRRERADTLYFGGGKAPQRFLQLVGGIGFQGDFCPLQAKNFP